jgi:excisionase family DNA binding protein
MKHNDPMPALPDEQQVRRGLGKKCETPESGGLSMKNDQTSSPETERLLRKSEVAEKLACSERTVERLVQDRVLNRVEIRGGVRYRESEVNKIIRGDKP